MRAHEFINEWKIVDRIAAGTKLPAAVNLFKKLSANYDDSYKAAAVAAKEVGIGPRMFQNYLLDHGMITETVLMDGYIAYALDMKSRQMLAAQFPPKYADFIGHHVTYKFGVKPDTPLPKGGTLKVVGYADDGESIEALVVEVNGKTTRPDGKTYHITWSLDRSKGRKPVHSNNLIANSGYDPVTPIDIKAKPEML